MNPETNGGASWADFHQGNPDLAQTGQRLLYQGGELASAFLATVEPDLFPKR